MLSPDLIEKSFALAKEQYAEVGVDVDRAIDALGRIAISLHCWQGDDVGGFEKDDTSLDGGIAVTGNYPGKARTPDQLRSDLEKCHLAYPRYPSFESARLLRRIRRRKSRPPIRSSRNTSRAGSIGPNRKTWAWTSRGAACRPGSSHSQYCGFAQRLHIIRQRRPSLRPFQHPPDHSHFHVHNRRTHSRPRSPLTESENVLRFNGAQSPSPEVFAWLHQQLPLFLLAGSKAQASAPSNTALPRPQTKDGQR